MGLFSSDNDAEQSRADILIENATNDSVDEKKLTQLKSGGVMSQQYLNDKPLIDYLHEGEQPHFILFATMNGPRSDHLQDLRQKGSGMFMHMVTDERWLIVVGNSKTGDETFVIPLEDITELSYKCARTKHKVFVSTERHGVITIPVSGVEIGKDDIQELVAFLEEHTSAEADADVPQEVNVTDEDWDRAANLVDRAESDSVTTEALIGHQGDYPHVPILQRLDTDETVEYILTDSDAVRGVGFDGKHNKVKPAKGKQSFYVVTDQRLLLIIPQEDTDRVHSLTYDEFRVTDFLTATNRSRLVLEGADVRSDMEHRTDERYDFLGNNEKDTVTYHLWLGSTNSTTGSKHRDAVRYLLKKTIGDVEYILFTPVQKGKLEILDRETGQAHMQTKTKGWEYGVGFLERDKSKSKAVIQEEGYEAEVQALVVTNDELIIQAEDPDGTGKQEIRRPFTQIAAVDEHDRGFTFYSSTGIYRVTKPHTIALQSYQEVDDEDFESAVEFIRERINASGTKDVEQTPNEASGSSDDGIEKIEKLADLKEQGILTEEEFQEKKTEILDNI